MARTGITAIRTSESIEKYVFAYPAEPSARLSVFLKYKNTPKKSDERRNAQRKTAFSTSDGKADITSSDEDRYSARRQADTESEEKVNKDMGDFINNLSF